MTSGFVTKVELFRAQFEVFLVVWVFGLSSAQVFFLCLVKAMLTRQPLPCSGLPKASVQVFSSSRISVLTESFCLAGNS